MNIREVIEILFSKENATDAKILHEENSGKQRILKIIFGKENVQDEELWNAGLGLCEDLIEVESQNISKYNEYKNNLLWEKILSKIGEVKTTWVELPDRQKDQIEVIMKIIAYGTISLKDCVTVINATGATIQFLQDLGYDTWGSSDSLWIQFDNAKKVKDDTKYLTAKTALTLSNYINTYVFTSFLKNKKSEGKDYVIIPIADIPIGSDRTKESARAILENLNLDFDLDTLVSSHKHKSLVFIDLRHVHFMEESQKERLEPLKDCLMVEL